MMKSQRTDTEKTNLIEEGKKIIFHYLIIFCFKCIK